MKRISRFAFDLNGWPDHLRLVCLLALLASSCSPPPEQPRIVKIGLLVDFGSTGGVPSLNAARLFASQRNRAGGLIIDGQGWRIDLVVEDTELNPGTTMKAARKLVYHDQVDAIIGPNYSSNLIAAGSIAESAEVVLISPGATLPESTAGKNFLFRVAYDDPVQGRILAEFAHLELQAQRIAVLFDISNPSSRSVVETFEATLGSLGAKAPVTHSYVVGESDFAGYIDELLSVHPDAILLPNPTVESIAQARYLEEVGFTGKILGTDNWGPDRVAAESGLQGAVFTQHWHKDFPGAGEHLQSFVSDYQSVFKSEPSPMAALTYDAFTVLVEAIEAGGLSGVAIANELRTMPPQLGLTGELSFDRSRAKRPLLLELVDGRIIHHVNEQVR